MPCHQETDRLVESFQWFPRIVFLTIASIRSGRRCWFAVTNTSRSKTSITNAKVFFLSVRFRTKNFLETSLFWIIQRRSSNLALIKPRWQRHKKLKSSCLSFVSLWSIETKHPASQRKHKSQFLTKYKTWTTHYFSLAPFKSYDPNETCCQCFKRFTSP